MKALIGDIGNTITKICLIEINSFKINRIIYFNNKEISSMRFLKKKINIINKNKNIYKIALFSSVVPRYRFLLEKFLKRNYNIQLREIKDKNIK